MNKLFLTIAVLFFLSVSVRAQECPTGMRCVPVETFNKMVGHLESLVEAKDVIAKMLAERGASDAAIASALKTIEGWKSLDEINNQIILKQSQVIVLYEKVMATYQKIVEDLEKRLLKPKSPFAKFLDVLKSAVTLLAGVALGRGL